MTKSFGWAGNLLTIDLTSGKTTKKSTTDYPIQELIGGLGLNAKIFWDMGCPEVAAFDPANPIIISAGPLTGTFGPFGRAEICTISPQSYPQELFSYSSIGGRFPSEMKFAGYDGIIVTGKAKEPVYLSVQDDVVEIKSAADLWGLDTFESQQVILKEEPCSSILVIGPAGENLSRVAVILSETKYAAGGGGYGAVMGSKNLKAIAIKGSGSVNIAKPDEIKILRELINKENKKTVMGRFFRLPFTAPEEIKQIYSRKYYVKQTGCYGCPQQCHSVNYFPGLGTGACSCASWQWSPQYSNSPRDIWEANLLTQKLGINAGEIFPGLPLLLKLAFVNNIITKKEIEEVMDLPTTRWLGGKASDHDFMKVFFYKIANGESPYSQGAARFVQHFSRFLAKGEEFTNKSKEVYTARGYPLHHLDNLGSVLHWAMDTRDPVDSCHEYKNNSPEAMKYFGLPPYSDYQLIDTSKTIYDRTEMVAAWVQDNQCIKNSLPICEWFSTFSSFFDPPTSDLRSFESRMLSAVTGWWVDPPALAKIGERIWNLRRAIMVKRENRTRNDDTINEPYFEKPIECHQGSALGLRYGPVDRNKFEETKDRYYALRGWDVKTGRPTMAKLEDLGLKDVADQLVESQNYLDSRSESNST